MSELPQDLVSLPTTPYDTRPDELPLNVEECRTALWLDRGNVTKAAQRLKVTPNRLRRFVDNSPRLREEVKEAREQLLDLSEDIMYDALTDEADKSRQDQMARFVATNLGGSRGFGNGKSGGGKVGVDLKKGKLVVQWGDGLSFGGEEKSEEKVIEHE